MNVWCRIYEEERIRTNQLNQNIILKQKCFKKLHPKLQWMPHVHDIELKVDLAALTGENGDFEICQNIKEYQEIKPSVKLLQ